MPLELEEAQEGCARPGSGVSDVGTLVPVYWGNIGIMEKKMETTIGFRVAQNYPQ